MDQRKVRNLTEGGFRHVVFTLCAYECVALATQKCPTLSKLSHRHRWLAPMLVGGLTVHLYRYGKRLEAELLAELAS